MARFSQIVLIRGAVVPQRTQTNSGRVHEQWMGFNYGPIIAVLAYLSVTKSIKKEELDFLESNPAILQGSSLIFRLSDDYGPSTVWETSLEFSFSYPVLVKLYIVVIQLLSIFFYAFRTS